MGWNFDQKELFKQALQRTLEEPICKEREEQPLQNENEKVKKVEKTFEKTFDEKDKT